MPPRNPCVHCRLPIPHRLTEPCSEQSVTENRFGVLHVRWSQLQTLVEEGLITDSVAEALWARLHAANASGAPGLTTTLLSLFSAVNVIYAVGSAAISAVFLYWVVHLLRSGPNDSELHKRRTGLAVTGLSLVYGFAFYKTGASLLQNPGSQITGGLLHTAAVLVVPLAMYGLLRAMGIRMYTTIQEARSVRDGINRMSSGFHLGSALMELSLLAASLLAYWHEDVPLLLAPAAISSYLLVVTATLAAHNRFPPFIQPPLVYSTLAYALGMVYICRLAGHEYPVIRMAALISAMNALAWSLPLALAKVVVAGDLMDGRVMRTFIEQAWEGDLSATGNMTVATYGLLQMVLLAYAVRVRTWVCIPYALVGLVAACNICRNSWRWAAFVCLPIGLFLVVATFASRGATDYALLNMLSLLGQPQTLLTYILWVVRVLMAFAACQCLWRGGRSMGVSEYHRSSFLGPLGGFVWGPITWTVIAVLTTAASDEPFLGVGGICDVQAVGWLILLGSNIMAVAAGDPALHSQAHSGGWLHWASSSGRSSHPPSSSEHAAALPGTMNGRALVGSTAMVLLGYRFSGLAAHSNVTVAIAAAFISILIGCMAFVPSRGKLVWLAAALLLSVGLTTRGLQTNWKLITLCGILGVYACVGRCSEWIYYAVPRDKRTACVCILLTAAGVATVKEHSRTGQHSSLPELLAVLSEHRFERSSLPSDLAGALAAETLPQEVLERYLGLQHSALAPLLQLRGFRERLLADPSFFVKVAIEVGIGIFTKTSAEYTKRGAAFSAELDFVAANILMALVADFMLVWLPAPTLSYSPKEDKEQNTLAAFFASCPDNAFQTVPPGYQPFTLAQRAGATVRNGAKLLAVGFTASLLGVGVTNAIIFVRHLLDPSWAPPNDPQDVLMLSLAYVSYMAVSSNIRYQVIAGVIEQRGIEVVFADRPRICNLLSFLVRTSNTFVGSLMWVDYIHLLGFQANVSAH
ncbi:hypothetical protein WJX72_000680 [[Myrmecia] bisecta]|uniref:Uncharacterized protein n=1 Tax=[Myrmecia] bisecta TaxID=41462 RepID=A0AAW1PNZ8_9CHLO